MLLALVQPPDRGELTHFGNKWGWAGTGEVFVPQLVMYATPPNFYGNPNVGSIVALNASRIGSTSGRR